MTTYYNKVMEPAMPKFLGAHPAAWSDTLYKLMGDVPITIPDPWGTDYLHYNYVKAQVNARISKRMPAWADGQAIPDPGVIPLDFASWSYTVDVAQFNSIRDNPNGPTAQTVKEGIARQVDYFKITVDKLMSGYTGLTAVRDDLGDWFGMHSMLAMESATVSKPGDLGHDGTGGQNYDLSATNISGADATVDAIQKVFGFATGYFFNCYSSVDQHSMFHGDGSDTFDFVAHPNVWRSLQGAHATVASGEIDNSTTIMNQIRELGTPHSSMVADAGYTMTDGATAEVMITMNTKENFMKVVTIPYTVTGWKPYNDPKLGECYRIMGYEKLGVICKPYLTNQLYYQKAFMPISVTPYEAT